MLGFRSSIDRRDSKQAKRALRLCTELSTILLERLVPGRYISRRQRNFCKFILNALHNAPRIWYREATRKNRSDQRAKRLAITLLLLGLAAIYRDAGGMVKIGRTGPFSNFIACFWKFYLVSCVPRHR
jgi:hypothetical protein